LEAISAPRIRSVYFLKKFLGSYALENLIKPPKKIKHRHKRFIKPVIDEEHIKNPLLPKKLQYFFRRIYSEYDVKPLKKLNKVAASKKKGFIIKKKIQPSAMTQLNEDYFRFADGIYASY